MNPYRFNINKNMLLATKGKIIFGFFLAIIALTAAWGVSKFVFDEMIATVDKVSKPDEKLSLVNNIFNRVSRLDQQQRYLASKNNENALFIKETRAIRLSLDTLKELYYNDSLQLRRIASIKKLLIDRDQQFILYLKVRDSLVNTRTFSNEVKKLNEIFSKRAFQSDSAVYTSESTTSTTTLSSDKNKGIFNKIFGKKKPESYKVVSEELKIKRDTLDEFLEDSILKDMESSLDVIENQQRLKSNKFIEKERNLAATSNKLTHQMLRILDEVRDEALTQINLNGAKARRVVNKGITQITYILLIFFAITIVLIYFILTDIGKSNQYRLALEKAKEAADENAQAKQRFLSNMSHEIRTPLQSIIGYAEIIKNNTLPPVKAINAIHQSAAHLLNIINEVLDYSRITSGKFTLKNEAFDVKSVVEEVMAIMQPLAAEKEIEFTSKTQFANGFWIYGDPLRLKQILFNLLGNAIKFTHKGEVQLIMNCLKEVKNAKLIIRVVDSGIGISAEQQKIIFDEFEHGKNLEKPLSAASTGLGLSIVKQLVDLHHGKIEVNSKEGEGAVFNITLNYVLAKKEENLEPPKELAFKLNASKSVWLIDDDQMILDLCSMILNQNNIPHFTFNHPKDVINYPVDESLAYVFMDMRMPEIDGFELFSILKNRLPNTVKYYAVTAQALEEEKQNILKIGFDGIVTKPFKENDLLNIFREPISEFENFDPTILKNMTFGNTQQLKKVLFRFTNDSLTDIMSLRKEIVNNDIDSCKLIVHRLAGRTGQIGYQYLAYSFRKTELKLDAQKTINDGLVNEVEENLSKLSRFINHIKENDYSI